MLWTSAYVLSIQIRRKQTSCFFLNYGESIIYNTLPSTCSQKYALYNFVRHFITTLLVVFIILWTIGSYKALNINILIHLLTLFRNSSTQK